MRVEQIESLQPSKIFLMCGVNSLGMDDDEFKSQYDMLINEIKKASPKSQLIIFNILPECNGELGNVSNNKKIKERNSFIREYTVRKKISMIDLYSIYANKNGSLYENITTDGLHLTPNGYDRMAEAISQYFVE